MGFKSISFSRLNCKVSSSVSPVRTSSRAPGYSFTDFSQTDCVLNPLHCLNRGEEGILVEWFLVMGHVVILENGIFIRNRNPE